MAAVAGAVATDQSAAGIDEWPDPPASQTRRIQDQEDRMSRVAPWLAQIAIFPSDEPFEVLPAARQHTGSTAIPALALHGREAGPLEEYIARDPYPIPLPPAREYYHGEYHSVEPSSTMTSSICSSVYCMTRLAAPSRLSARL